MLVPHNWIAHSTHRESTQPLKFFQLCCALPFVALSFSPVGYAARMCGDALELQQHLEPTSGPHVCQLSFPG